MVSIVGKITGLIFWNYTFYTVWRFFTTYFIDEDIAKLQGLILFIWVPAVIMLFGIPTFFFLMFFYNVVKLIMKIIVNIFVALGMGEKSYSHHIGAIYYGW